MWCRGVWRGCKAVGPGGPGSISLRLFQALISHFYSGKPERVIKKLVSNKVILHLKTTKLHSTNIPVKPYNLFLLLMSVATCEKKVNLYTLSQIVVNQTTLPVVEPTVCVIQQCAYIPQGWAYYFSKPPCLKCSMHQSRLHRINQTASDYAKYTAKHYRITSAPLIISHTKFEKGHLVSNFR